MDCKTKEEIRAVIAYAANVFVTSVDDPDYCVFKFVAQKGNYYHGLTNIDFDIAQLV